MFKFQFIKTKIGLQNGGTPAKKLKNDLAEHPDEEIWDIIPYGATDVLVEEMYRALVVSCMTIHDFP